MRRCNLVLTYEIVSNGSNTRAPDRVFQIIGVTSRLISPLAFTRSRMKP